MRKMVKILGIAMVVAAILVVAVAGAALAAGQKGPAPNSGDCIPDGSGWVAANGTNSNGGDCIPNNYSYNHNYLTPAPH